jgi:multicomponent Na+:H+ antiporter subunit E
MASGLFFLKRLAIFFGLWLVLSGADLIGVAFGLPTAALAALFSMRLLPPGGREVSLVRLIAMVPGFLARSVRGGIDVAWRALHPRLPIAPGWLHWRTKLPPGGPRVTLGSELSLLPGTLVAGSRGDVLYVHCLDIRKDITTELAAEEARIAATIGEASK